MSIKITKQVPYEIKESYTVQVPYQIEESYTVQVPYQIEESYTVQVPYQNPINEIIEHRDPVYETLYTYTLTDVSSDTRTNVYKATNIRTGTDFWGNTEYMWTLYYYTSIPDGSKTSATFYEINEYSRTSFQGIISYNEWSEEIISGYETKYRTETKYKMVTKNRNEIRYKEITKYKDVIKYRTVTKYRDVTKTVYEWWIG
jgi:hypothetical protein